MKADRQLGFLLLAAWLIVQGLVQLIGLHFQGLGTIMGVVAIAAGVLLVIRR